LGGPEIGCAGKVRTIGRKLGVLETGRIVLKGSGRELRNHALIKSAFLGLDSAPVFENEAVELA
jgi:hypothetical protein